MESNDKSSNLLSLYSDDKQICITPGLWSHIFLIFILKTDQACGSPDNIFKIDNLNFHCYVKSIIQWRFGKERIFSEVCLKSIKTNVGKVYHVVLFCINKCSEGLSCSFILYKLLDTA